MRKKHTGTLSLKGVGADDDLKKYIGRQIASIRKGSDLTARQVAERLKVSRETLTQIETGRNNPTALMLWKLACLFQCEVSDFFPQIPEGFGLTVYTKSDMRRINKIDPGAAEWAGKIFGVPNK